jgi:hypothetical protein
MLSLANLRYSLEARTRAEGFSNLRGHWSIFFDADNAPMEPKYIWVDDLVQDLGEHIIPDGLSQAIRGYNASAEYLALFSFVGGTYLFRVPFSTENPPVLLLL